MLRYRQLLAADRRYVRALIAIEQQRFDESWLELTAQEGIVLTWPDGFADTVSARLTS